MPRVRMLTSAASPEGEAWQEGEVVEMTAGQAEVWADGVRGELVRDVPPSTPEQRRQAPSTTARARVKGGESG